MDQKTETLSKDGDEIEVTRTTYSGGKDGSEVVLVVIEEGGHTWPGHILCSQVQGGRLRHSRSPDNLVDTRP